MWCFYICFLMFFCCFSFTGFRSFRYPPPLLRWRGGCPPLTWGGAYTVWLSTGVWRTACWDLLGCIQHIPTWSQSYVSPAGFTNDWVIVSDLPDVRYGDLGQQMAFSSVFKRAIFQEQSRMPLNQKSCILDISGSWPFWKHCSVLSWTTATY